MTLKKSSFYSSQPESSVLAGLLAGESEGLDFAWWMKMGWEARDLSSHDDTIFSEGTCHLPLFLDWRVEGSHIVPSDE